MDCPFGNDQGTNQATLHTSPGCTVPAAQVMTGTALNLDCDTAVAGNAGCGVKLGQATSYGPAFNAKGGRWCTPMLNLIVVADRYATEHPNSFISVWFRARDDPAVPADVKAGGGSVDTDSWGTPSATFPSTTCDIEERFAAHNIIINLTFYVSCCGDWAGQASIYASSGCPSTCNDFVNTNPAAFVDAFFEFNAINVYTLLFIDVREIKDTNCGFFIYFIPYHLNSIYTTTPVSIFWGFNEPNF
ncbi:glycoside hydrolase family 16 protein [Mycena olivaceomarginata]|nr:glycoside hydrolase family 16 protein [Mycena olivaceomarginata]